jgi:hypothetical protein
MLPQSYQLPALVVLVLSGALTCFAGYRFFRLVLAIYGFVLGALLASSVMGTSNAAGMILGGLAGGIAGALILVFAYFVGIALVGAGLGALLAHVGWSAMGTGGPPAAVIIVLAILGAIAAMVLQRYVIIVSTACGGAWTILVASLALVGDRVAARAVVTGEVWILYPMTPALGDRWVPVMWIVLSLVGTAVQLGITGRRR